MDECTSMLLPGLRECLIFYRSLKWGPPTAPKLWQQKILLAFREGFLLKKLTFKKSKSVFCTWQGNWYYLNNKIKGFGFKFWLLNMKCESIVLWNQQFVWVRRWARTCQFHPDSRSLCMQQQYQWAAMWHVYHEIITPLEV